jgi:hypothetical protein
MRYVVLIYLGYCLFTAKATTAQDPKLTTRDKNEVFADFVLPEYSERLATSSQSIDRVIFSGSKFGKIHLSENAPDASLRHGNHAAIAVVAPQFDRQNGQDQDGPQITFSLQLLPALPSTDGHVATGRLTAIYNGFDMSPIHGWFPNETMLGVFGATFVTQKRQTGSSERELVRVEGTTPDLRSGFSLPIDVCEFSQVTDTSRGRSFEFLPCSVYEDFAGTHWLIYCHMGDGGVEISQCKTLWEDAPIKHTLLERPLKKLYRIGDDVVVSNMKFRVAEIVEWNTQTPRAAWVNISAIDIVR